VASSLWLDRIRPQAEHYNKTRWIRRRQFSGFFFNAHSQMRITRQPARRKTRFTSRSRTLFADNFHRQNARLFFGLVACLGQPCQKQPSTNTASRACRKTKSTFTRSSRGDEAPVNFGFLILDFRFSV
jgi:hypothetical protein